MEEIRGYVEHVIFRNKENGYTVLELECESELVTCVGLFHSIGEGELLSGRGEFIINPSYGRQFQVTDYEVRVPEDVKSMERYLASGAIKGIGAALADRIIRRFGEDTFRIIEEEPERLSEIKGISEKKAVEIAEQIENKKDIRKIMMYLQQYGISYALALKLHKHYGEQLYDVMKENPYKFAEDIQGIGFQIADEIARKAGISSDSDYRIRSGLLYSLMLALRNGHLYLPYEELLRNTSELLNIESEHMERHIMDLCIDKKLWIQEREGERCVYAAQNYYLELNIARMLNELNITYETDHETISIKIAELEREENIHLDEMQRNAVLEAATQGLFIITGGPGTGKTTTIKTIIHYFEAEGMDIFLAAPTGRAAKRMTETTGYEAQTIHRLLELSGGIDETAGKAAEFGRNEQNPLEADVIIIDEASMVDIYLMNSLLRAVLVGTRLIFVGDVNQLPSVGPGCVLKDMIDSEVLKVVRLNKIFRQALQSDIIMNAHKINKGEQVSLNNNSRDFFFLSREEVVLVQRVVLALVQEKLPKYVHVNPFDVQVLTPTRKGALGVVELNRILQKYLNPASEKKAEKETVSGLFREGDKVMQIKNNYQLEWEIVNKYNIPVDKGMGVFNGDVGIIQYINNQTETLQIIFDDERRVQYSFQQLDELELAYAITIHKSQGSEYPAVVIPMLNGPRLLMNRNILYTAVTRAKSCVTIVGSEEVFHTMIRNVNENNRYSGLKYAIKQINES